ncbi:MAG: MotA/TolQ/ExbB proton channel family protein [Pseudomonadales bacterium]|nr:MotA/TolQ/ExbB proton channel family protein [Pseudomonadales bacterium]
MSLWELMEKGGPIMWPLLVTSLISATVVLERLFFVVRETRRRQPQVVADMLGKVERNELEQALATGRDSSDFVARTLAQGIEHRRGSAVNALLNAASQELRRFNQGLTMLDTAITLGPLLGLLGTVTGMIRSFGMLGSAELSAPAVITGGIAEALIATAAGLGVAIVALIPFNYLNARAEEARHELEDASTRLELLLLRSSAEGDQ